MAGVLGNKGWIMAQKQTALGTPATVALPGPAVAGAYKSPLVGGGVQAARNIAQLSETDANRDIGVSYVSSQEAQGSPEIYCRDDSLGFWLQATLGADAVTGTTNFTHTLTPASTLPYLTVWRNVGDLLWEQFNDCKVSSLAISAQPGAPLTATATLIGRGNSRLTTDPSTAAVIPLGSSYVYNENDATITLSGGVTALVGQFSITIENGVTSQYTDNLTPIDVVEGLRQVTLSFDLVFQTLTEYNNFYYGGAAGTTTSNAVYTNAADFLFTKGANNSLEFNIPSMAYQTFPVDVNPAGNPITVAVTAIAQRGTNVITATVKNQVAVY